MENEVIVTSVGQFLVKIQEATKSWSMSNMSAKPWFRGQTDKEKPLIPSIFRAPGYDEINLTLMFRNRAEVLGQVPARSGSIDEWLFLMQHFLVPTRLLDWTESAIVALFFSVHEEYDIKSIPVMNNQKALDNADPECHDGAVWLLHPLELNKLTGKVGECFPNTWSDHPDNRTVRANFQIPFGLKEARNDASEYPIAILATYSERVMSAQKSCFTIFGKIEDDFETMFNNKSLIKNGYFCKYIIPQNVKQKIRDELDLLGTTHSVIFPDFKHLGIELKDRFSKKRSL